MLFLQPPQKQERQVTPKKAQEMKNEDDEYACSTDVDEPGLLQITLKLTETQKSIFFPLAWSFKYNGTRSQVWIKNFYKTQEMCLTRNPDPVIQENPQTLL